MFYSVRHITRYRYSAPITESIMKAHMQPRSEGVQRCHQFNLTTDPRSRVMAHRDHLANVVHHFDIPRRHTHLTITAESLVEIETPPSIPDRLDPESWRELDDLVAQKDYWEMLMPSRFARPSELL
jgi:transglutaminase-like putative cysteine protease